MLRIELRKALSGPAFKIAFITACALVLWHIVIIYGLMQQLYLEAAPGRFTGKYNLFYWWLPIDCISAPYAFFYGLFPMLACLPYAWSYMSERNSKYEYQMITRSSSKQYYLAKYMAVFLSGGIVIAVPLAIDLAAAALFSPAMRPNIFFSMPGFSREGFLTPVYYSHPWIFCFAVLTMEFLWGSSIASLSFTFVTAFKSSFLGVVMPVVAIYVWDIFAAFVRGIYTYYTGNYLEFSILKLLHTCTNNPNPAWLQLTIIAILCTISALSTIAIAARKDKL